MSLCGDEGEKRFEIWDGLKEQQGTLIYELHKLDEVYKISDRVSVMRDGKLIGSRMTGELPRHELIRMMIGREAREQRIGDTRTNRDNVILQVDNLAKAGKCKNASFELREGEILGFYGLVGAGRTELARVLIGEERAESGTIKVNGQIADIRTISDALFRYRMGYVTENRKEEGLFLEEPILTNLTLLIWNRIRHPWTRFISTSKET